MDDENEITDENYCDWKQSNCNLVAGLRADLAKTERDCMLMAKDANEWKARAAAAIDGDYNAGVEDAAERLEDEGWYALAAEIRKLKKAPRP